MTVNYVSPRRLKKIKRQRDVERSFLKTLWRMMWVKLVLKFMCKMCLDSREECFYIEVEIWRSNAELKHLVL